MNIFGDQTIKAGDMAMVVRDCCGHWLGRVVDVESLVPMRPEMWLECVVCKKQWSNITFAFNANAKTNGVDLYRAPLHWLKKIDPSQETDIVDEREETPVKSLQPE